MDSVTRLLPRLCQGLSLRKSWPIATTVTIADSSGNQVRMSAECAPCRGQQGHPAAGLCGPRQLLLGHRSHQRGREDGDDIGPSPRLCDILMPQWSGYRMNVRGGSSDSSRAIPSKTLPTRSPLSQSRSTTIDSTARSVRQRRLASSKPQARRLCGYRPATSETACRSPSIEGIAKGPHTIVT